MLKNHTNFISLISPLYNLSYLSLSFVKRMKMSKVTKFFRDNLVRNLNFDLSVSRLALQKLLNNLKKIFFLDLFFMNFLLINLLIDVSEN